MIAAGFAAVSGPAAALSTTYLAPGYTASAVPNLPLSTSALAFDAAGTAYVSPVPPSNPLPAAFDIRTSTAPAFASTAPYSTYPNTGSLGPAIFVTGLDFSSSGKLYASETLASLNAGYIRDLSTGNVVLPLPSFRPTGIDVTDDNTIYVTARKGSDPNFGGVYRWSAGAGVLEEIIPGIPGQGIAVHPSGDVYVSTRPITAYGYVSNSIYRFRAGTREGTLIATLDGNGAEELAFDPSGKLYALGAADAGGFTPAIAITLPAPLEVTSLAFGYSVTTSAFLPAQTRALAIDSLRNAYFVALTLAAPAAFELRFALPPDYASSVQAVSLQNPPLGASEPAGFVNGLEFSPLGSYTSESYPSQNAGYLRNLDTGAVALNLPDHRPTGIAVSPLTGWVYYTARKASDASFGGVYRWNPADPLLPPALHIPGIVGRGVAVTASGDLYVPTRGGGSPVAGYQPLSLYRFPNGTTPGTLVATFNAQGVSELAMDDTGRIYALGDENPSGYTPMVVITPPVATSSGPNPQATPIDSRTGGSPVTLSFPIADGGATALSTSTVGPALPPAAEKCSAPVFLDITTTASLVAGMAEVCVRTADLGITCPASVVLNRYEPATGGYTALQVGPNHTPGAGVVCGLTEHFSKFVIFAAASTSISVAVSPPTVTAGAPVTLTATVTGNSPTGTVQFLANGVNLGNPVGLVNGVATLVTTLPAGQIAISANYSGDGDDAAASAPAVIETVTSAPTAQVPLDAPWFMGALAVLLMSGAYRARRGRPARSK